MKIKTIEITGNPKELHKKHNPADFFIQPERYGFGLENELDTLLTHTSKLIEKGLPLYVMSPDIIGQDQAINYGLDGKERYMDVGIREQHIFAMAHSLSVCDPEARIIIKSHDSFVYRAVDQIQAINLGGSRVILIGAYGGLAGNLNGETHISTGQAGVMLMTSARVFEPADAQDFWRSVNFSLVNNPGLMYIRLYSQEAETLPKLDTNLWYYRTLEPQPQTKPQAVLVSCGLTAWDTFTAGKQLEAEGIPTRVINVVSPNATQGKEFASLFEQDVPIITTYNGNPLILEALVSTALLKYSDIRPRRIDGLGFVKGTTGSISDLKSYYDLDSVGILNKARAML